VQSDIYRVGDKTTHVGSLERRVAYLKGYDQNESDSCPTVIWSEKEKQPMSLVLEAPPVPLRTDEHGALRVGKTRIPLDTVVDAFNQGASAEEIVMSYPSLELGDVYAVVNYYLHNRTEVDANLSQREAESSRIKK
jgi:uncharacterized protein (DUF433 family)